MKILSSCSGQLTQCSGRVSQCFPVGRGVLPVVERDGVPILNSLETGSWQCCKSFGSCLLIACLCLLLALFCLLPFLCCLQIKFLVVIYLVWKWEAIPNVTWSDGWFGFRNKAFPETTANLLLNHEQTRNGAQVFEERT